MAFRFLGAATAEQHRLDPTPHAAVNRFEKRRARAAGHDDRKTSIVHSDIGVRNQ
jgi:hypothetical protein